MMVDSVKPTFASGSGTILSFRGIFHVNDIMYDIAGKSLNTRHITDVVHYSISTNSKFVSMCENLKPEKHSDPISQISVYSLSTLHLLKTLNHTVLSLFTHFSNSTLVLSFSIRLPTIMRASHLVVPRFALTTK